jgi:hypothetical protein
MMPELPSRPERLIRRTIARAWQAAIGLALSAGSAFAAPMDHRPANFFSVVLEKDKDVCGSVLASLNKEHWLPQALYRLDNPNFITDLLLASDLQIEWQHFSLESGNGLDYVSLDLANDGRPISVFRWNLVDGLGYHNILLTMSKAPDEISAGKTLQDNIVTKIAGEDRRNVLKIDWSTSDYWTSDSYPVNWTFHMNILRVENKSFLLVAGSKDAERTALRGGGFNVFVMEYRSRETIPVVCHFRGGKDR